MTPTAIVGLSAGANAVKTESGWLPALVSAVPVLPAMPRFCAPAWVTGVVAVPLLTTAIIICFS
jgi:hypothetical protein